MDHQRPQGPEDEITIKEADGDVVVIRDHADDVAVEVTIRHEGGHEIIEVDVVDVEEHGRDNRCPPPARHYKIKVDGKPFVFDKRHVTGEDILVKAGKTPVARYELEKRVHGGAYVAIALNETVDLGEKGIERFETFPLDETEG